MLDNPWIYLLRHGEIDSPDQRRFIGQMDEPLSARGIVQALWWRKRWASTTFARVCCSDLVRSEHTAELVAGSKRDQIEVVPELREISLGQWEGRSVEEIKRKFPNEWQERGSHLDEYRPAGGESFSDLSARVLPFFQQILSQVTGPVLIAGHAGVNRVILCHLLGIPLKNALRLGQDYGALNVIESAAGNWRLRKMNLCPTLP
jgi:alpha-ribazole phosphatase